MADDASTPPDTPAQDDEALSLPKAAAALLRDLPGLLTDRIRLLSLEVRRAMGALGQMVVLGLVTAILCATAWLALWVGIAAAIIEAGLAWPWTCALVLFVNVAAAIWAARRAMALAPLLGLPATLRRLTDSDAPERLRESQQAREQEPSRGQQETKSAS